MTATRAHPRLFVISAEIPADQSASGFAPRLRGLLLAAREQMHVTLALIDGPGGEAGVIDTDLFAADRSRILTPPRARGRERTLRGRLQRALVQYPFDPLPYHAYPRRSRQLRRLLDVERPDLVVIYLPYLLGLLRECPADTPVIAVLEEPWEWVVASAIGQATRKDTWLGHREATRFERLYRWADPRLAAAVAISDEERDHFSTSIAPGKLSVLPHGVDTLYYAPAARTQVERDIDVLVVGKLRAPHNLDGALRAWAAARGKDWRWAFVGEIDDHIALQLREDGCLVSGPVPDTRPYYERARCVLVPALSGRGVKTTVLQAWAMGRPLVTSPVGARGVPAKAGENVLVGADAAAMIEHVNAVLMQPELARRLGAAGRATVVRERDIRGVAERFVNLCLQTAGPAQPFDERS